MQEADSGTNVPGTGAVWYALWLLAQGWTASATAEALEWDPHTIGRWAFGEGGAAALVFKQSGGPPRPGRGAFPGGCRTAGQMGAEGRAGAGGLDQPAPGRGGAGVPPDVRLWHTAGEPAGL